MRKKKDTMANRSHSELFLEKRRDFSGFVDIGPGTRTRLKDRVLALFVEGGHPEACSGCGACASGCPASGLDGMDPRMFVRMLCLGMDEEIQASNWVWMCTTCSRCVPVCPMQINIPCLVYGVRSCWPLENRPAGIVAHCKKALKNDTGSATDITRDDFKFIIAEIADEIRQTQPGFEQLSVPMDKKGAALFLNQNSIMPSTEPREMAPLWKILHLAGADWTYASTGWAAENYGMFLSDDAAWEQLVRAKAACVDMLGCQVLVSTESGHDYFAVCQGLERFKIPHSFKVKSIVEYYAEWIRSGRLKVNSDWNLDLKIKFTLQDPCQLVRKGYGDFIADELRFVVKQAVGEENFMDMSPNRSNNYCCGGGGGALQSDFHEERRHCGKIKLDQILETGADYCITPCSNCHAQILDLSRSFKAGFRPLHLWSVICLAMGVLGENERKYLGKEVFPVKFRSTGSFRKDGI